MASRLIKRAPEIIMLGMVLALGCPESSPAAAEKTSDYDGKLPAIGAPNFDLAISGGVLDDQSQAIVSGTASLPVSNDYGVQFDGSLSSGEGSDRGGIAGHFFYRDPESHLVGGTVMWGRIGNYDVLRIGPEAEWYAGDVSLYVNGGFQEEDGGSTGYGTASASYYVTDNWVVNANLMGFSDVRGFGGGTEWKPESVPFSLYVEAGDDNRSAGYALAGLRMSFGTEGVSLKDRHRRYDPPNIVYTFSAAQSQSVQPKPTAASTPTPPAPVCVPPPGCICDNGSVVCI